MNSMVVVVYACNGSKVSALEFTSARLGTSPWLNAALGFKSGFGRVGRVG